MKIDQPNFGVGSQLVGEEKKGMKGIKLTPRSVQLESIRRALDRCHRLLRSSKSESPLGTISNSLFSNRKTVEYRRWERRSDGIPSLRKFSQRVDGSDGESGLGWTEVALTDEEASREKDGEPLSEVGHSIDDAVSYRSVERTRRRSALLRPSLLLSSSSLPDERPELTHEHPQTRDPKI